MGGEEIAGRGQKWTQRPDRHKTKGGKHGACVLPSLEKMVCEKKPTTNLPMRKKGRRLGVPSLQGGKFGRPAGERDFMKGLSILCPEIKTRDVGLSLEDSAKKGKILHFCRTGLTEVETKRRNPPYSQKKNPKVCFLKERGGHREQ